jgi:hypothetical protein
MGMTNTQWREILTPEQQKEFGVSITIITNHVPRDVIEGYELSADEREQFEYINWRAVQLGEASPQFARYKGELLDLGEFMAWTDHDYAKRDFPGWHGYKSDSFFSGLLIRYCDDYERVVIGRFYA